MYLQVAYYVRNFLLVEELLASDEELCSMELLGLGR